MLNTCGCNVQGMIKVVRLFSYKIKILSSRAHLPLLLGYMRVWNCVLSKRLLLWNRLTKINNILHEVFCRRSTNNLFSGFFIIEKDDRHVHIWFKNLLVRNQGGFEVLFHIALGIQGQLCCSNKIILRLPLTFFTAWSNLRPTTFVWRNWWKIITLKCIKVAETYNVGLQ